jgi:hypothetical protein
LPRLMQATQRTDMTPSSLTRVWKQGVRYLTWICIRST